MKQTRREFIEFLGYSTLALSTVTIPGCVKNAMNHSSLTPLKSGLATDSLILVPGMQYSIIAQWGDAINSKEHFGFNNDYLAFFPDEKNNPASGTMWVNHEYIHPFFVSGYDGKSKKSKDQVDQEQLSLGGSVIRIQRNESNKWELVRDENRNYRLTAKTEIPLSQPILGKSKAIGTFAGCAGGVTPWGTVLSCEENYQDAYGERKEYGKPETKKSDYPYHWEEHYNNPPEHYGWVVEVNTQNKTAKKLISLGRFSHESATVVQASDGRSVVYMGDDKDNEFIYKFISKKEGSLDEGTLYVANTEKGTWLPLDLNLSPILKKTFKNQTDVMIWARMASKILGATPQDRPEDVEINPNNGEILVALTNNYKKNNMFGSILSIKEKGNDYLSLEFSSSTFITGGEETGFACPDNLAFDPAGNLWFTTDMSGSKMKKPPYKKFGNNGLFVIPQTGKNAGKAIQIASAPFDAEFTGPCFTPDGKTLFLSVQHPGEQSKSLTELTSHWPKGGNELPRPAVVAISGPTLEMLTHKLS
jgi:secreted PhoX family phosphatase